MTLKRSTGSIPSRSGTSGMPSPGGDGRGQWRLHEVVVDFWCCHAMSYAIRDGTKLCSIYGRYEGLERNGERESKRRIKQNKTPDHSRTQPTEERKSGAGNQKVGWHVAGAGATGSDKRKGVGGKERWGKCFPPLATIKPHGCGAPVIPHLRARPRGVSGPEGDRCNSTQGRRRSRRARG